MYRMVQQPDGSIVYVDESGAILTTNPFTGEPLYQDVPAMTEMRAALTTSAPPSPGAPALPAAALPAPGANVGPYGLPLDPLGDGLTVPGGAPPPAAGAVPAPSGSGSGWVDYGSASYGNYDYRYSRDPRYAPPPPTYGNGAIHPFFGGAPLVPGGGFAQPGAPDNRQQVYVPGGAAAGPYETRAAQMPSARSYGGSASGGGGGGGGGGIAKDIYWHFANKIRDKLTGGGSANYGDYPPYREDRIRPYLGPTDPKTVRQIETMDAPMRGRYASKWDEDMAKGLYTNPQYMLGAKNVLPNINTDSLLYDRLSGLPMAQLTMLSGANRRGFHAGVDMMEDVYDDYYKKLNTRLSHGRQGIDFAPFYAKYLKKDDSLMDYTNQLGGLYTKLGHGQVFDTRQLFGNLADPAKGTYFGKAFHPGRSGDKAQAMGDTYLTAFNSILQAGAYGDIQRQVLADRASDMVGAYYARYSGKNPKAAPALNRWVSRRV